MLDLGILRGKQPSASFWTGVGKAPGVSPKSWCIVPGVMGHPETCSSLQICDVSDHVGHKTFPELSSWSGRKVCEKTQDKEKEQGSSLQCAGGMRRVTVGWTERRSPAATWIHQILSQFSHFVSFTKKEKKNGTVPCVIFN